MLKKLLNLLSKMTRFICFSTKIDLVKYNLILGILAIGVAFEDFSYQLS